MDNSNRLLWIIATRYYPHFLRMYPRKGPIFHIIAIRYYGILQPGIMDNSNPLLWIIATCCYPARPLKQKPLFWLMPIIILELILRIILILEAPKRPTMEPVAR